MIGFEDEVKGRIDQAIDRDVGDFVLRRGDGIHAYQLAASVDDLAMGFTHVVRADDLLLSTPRQLLLMTLLGATSLPAYVHVPLVVAADGTRLAKRTPGGIVRTLRDRGLAPEEIIGTLAHGLGLVGGDPRPMTPGEVVSAVDTLDPGLLKRWRRDPWRIPARWGS